MNYFYYKENELYCEDVLLKELAEEFDTPLYVYSKKSLLDNIKAFQSSLALLGGKNHFLNYALKANSNPILLRILSDAGIGADVVSAGELSLALKAGFLSSQITFSGVGKREEEIEYALQKNIFCVHAESVQELHSISKIAKRLGITAQTALRINPEIDAQSHPYVTTGLKQSKFGFEGAKIIEYLKIASSLPNINCIGLHIHIGSQITKTEPLVSAAQYIVTAVNRAREAGISISYVNFGGGYGVPYQNIIEHETLPKENDVLQIPTISDFISSFLPILEQTGCQIWIEPGRAIIADSGILITKTLYLKENAEKHFVVVDAGMTELIRPALYGSYHQIIPLSINTLETDTVDIVGPVCESSDFLAKNRKITKLKTGQYLGILTTGAYGFALSSNYNSRPKPAEVLVNGDKVRVIRDREMLKLE